LSLASEKPIGKEKQCQDDNGIRNDRKTAKQSATAHLLLFHTFFVALLFLGIYLMVTQIWFEAGLPFAFIGAVMLWGYWSIRRIRKRSQKSP